MSVRILAMEERPGGAVMVVGSTTPGAQLVYLLESPLISGSSAELLGAVNLTGGSDVAFDAARDVLYEDVGASGNDDSGGVLYATSVAQGGMYALENDFSFPLYDPGAQALVGLTLVSGGAQGYARNLTVLTPSGPTSYNATSHGSIGDGLYVVLEDGPKAIDPINRRAFFMLASGPFAEFELAAIDLDSYPPRIDEAPGICGFIGYCPVAIAYGP